VCFIIATTEIEVCRLQQIQISICGALLTLLGSIAHGIRPFMLVELAASKVAIEVISFCRLSQQPNGSGICAAKWCL
jgi:hypothetical protein